MTEEQKSLAKKRRERYYKKKYEAAPLIECECGKEIKSVSLYGRPQRYVNGHNNRKYKTKWEHKRVWQKKNPSILREHRRKHNRRYKIILIEMLGSKCNKCGIEYDGKNECIFDFHHKDPNEKKFGISSKLTCYSLKRLKAETKKCFFVMF